MKEATHELTKCACEQCKCTFSPDKGVEKAGKIYCGTACAEGNCDEGCCDAQPDCCKTH